MNAPLGWLEHVDVEALRTDRYLDMLLSAADRRAADAPALVDIDPDLRAVAQALYRGAVRVHPSFRFEERLARRLALAATAARPSVAAGGGAADGIPTVVVFGTPDRDAEPVGETGASRVGRPGRPVRPLLVGGALTSAAISIAGAAFVAWRLTRAAGLPVGPAGPAAGPGTDLFRRLD